MVFRFVATAAGGAVEEDYETVAAGCSEHPDGGGFVLDFMCKDYEPDDQDVALGLDTHCLVTADQGTAYGCVRELTWRAPVLTVVLDPAALPDLGLDDPVVETEIRAPRADVEAMLAHLPRILAWGRADARPRLTGLDGPPTSP